MISLHSGGSLYLPKLGLISPEKTLRVVLLPIPFWPSKPKTVPGEGIGRRKSLKLFSPKRWLQSFSSSSGKLTMLIAWKGHFLTQMPHPLQSVSEIIALSPSTLIASTRLRTIGQKCTQSWLHFFVLHLSVFNTASRVISKRPLLEFN